MATINPQSFSENVAAYGEAPRRATPEEKTEKAISQSTATEEVKSELRAKAAGKYFESGKAEERLRAEGPASPYWSAYKDLAVKQNPNLRDPLAVSEDRAQEAQFKNQQFRTAKQAGLTDEMARAHSEKAWGNALTEKRIAMKKGLLSADEHQMALDQEEENLNAKQIASVLRAKARSFDPDNMSEFPQQILAFTADYAHDLANPAVKAEIEPFLTQLSARHKASESSVNSIVASMASDLKLKAATPTMFDPATGRFNSSLASSEIERLRAEKAKRELEQKGAESELATQRQFDVLERRQKLKEESPEEQRRVSKDLRSNLDSLYRSKKDVLSEFGGGVFEKPSFAADASGNKVDPSKATHVVWKTKDKKNPIIIKSIGEYKDAASRLQNINSSISDITEQLGGATSSDSESGNKGLTVDKLQEWADQGMTREEALEKARKDGYTF